MPGGWVSKEPGGGGGKSQNFMNSVVEDVLANVLQIVRN